MMNKGMKKKMQKKNLSYAILIRNIVTIDTVKRFKRVKSKRRRERGRERERSHKSPAIQNDFFFKIKFISADSHTCNVFKWRKHKHIHD